MTEASQEFEDEKENTMRRFLIVFTMAALLAGFAYGAYQWASDDRGIKVDYVCRVKQALDEADIRLAITRKKVQDFGVMVKHIHQVAKHLQHTAEQEPAMHDIENIVDDIEKDESLCAGDESVILLQTKTDPRMVSSEEYLSIARKYVQRFTNKSVPDEELHGELLRILRLAPSHQQILQARLSALEMKVGLLRDHWNRLKMSPATDESQRMELYVKVKQTIEEVSQFGDRFISGSNFELDSRISGCHIRSDNNNETIMLSGASAERARKQVDAMLGSK